MVVDGRAYARDLIVFPFHVRSEWHRRKLHGLCLDDLDEVMKYLPEVLVIGRGCKRRLRVGKILAKTIEDEGVQLFADRTPEAVGLYNELAKSGRYVVGAFHIGS